VPADHGFRRDDEEGLLPSQPDPPNDYPKELIEEGETRARMVTFQHSELLAEHEILQNKIPAATEKTNQGAVPEEEQTEHGEELYKSNDWKYCCKLLILQLPRVLARECVQEKADMFSRR